MCFENNPCLIPLSLVCPAGRNPFDILAPILALRTCIRRQSGTAFPHILYCHWLIPISAVGICFYIFCCLFFIYSRCPHSGIVLCKTYMNRTVCRIRAEQNIRCTYLITLVSKNFSIRVRTSTVSFWFGSFWTVWILYIMNLKYVNTFF